MYTDQENNTILHVVDIIPPIARVEFTISIVAVVILQIGICSK